MDPTTAAQQAALDAPAYALADAGTIAGLNVRRIINEPTAAALEAPGGTKNSEGKN